MLSVSGTHCVIRLSDGSADLLTDCPSLGRCPGIFGGLFGIDVSSGGTVSDPYERLKAMARDMLPEGVDVEAGDGSIIAEGGAAATAYARLQFERMDAKTRERIESALLRYCELDTLAMAMVVEA